MEVEEEEVEVEVEEEGGLDLGAVIMSGFRSTDSMCWSQKSRCVSGSRTM